MWREQGQDERVEQAKLKASGVTPKAADAVAVIDGKLQAAITDLSSLLTKYAPHSLRDALTLVAVRDDASAQLQTHIQDCCSEALMGVATEVEAMLKELGQKIAAHPGPAAAPRTHPHAVQVRKCVQVCVYECMRACVRASSHLSTEEPDVSFYVDDCLFLGRVCRSVVEQSKQLPKIFPPTVVPLVPSAGGSDPLSRRPATAGSPVPRLRTATKNVENALLKQVCCECGCVSRLCVPHPLVSCKRRTASCIYPHTRCGPCGQPRS